MSDNRTLFLMLVQTAALALDIENIHKGGESNAGVLMSEAINIPESDLPEFNLAFAQFIGYYTLDGDKPSWLPPDASRENLLPYL